MAQFNKNTQQFQGQTKSLYEVTMLANKNGNPIDASNPLNVSLGTENVTITGNVNVGTSVAISNFPATQAVSDGGGSLTVDGSVNIGTMPEVEVKNDAGNPLAVNGTVTVQDGGGSLTVDGTVNIGTMPEVEVKNDTGNPLSISKNTTVNSESNPLYVEVANVAATSKDRMKITTYSTGFFNTFQSSKALDIWDETLTTGGTSTHDPNRSAVAIAVTSSVGSKVVRQTRNVMRYVPGRPAEYSQAFNMNGATAGIRQRVGMFDDNNGFYFERSASGVLYFVIRSSVTGAPVETRITQSTWNGDKLDGTGASGVTLDLTKTQLLVVDYEWYGTGAVAFSFVINNQTVRAHTFYHANVLSNPWCSTPFVPMRIEMENVSGSSASTMYQISSCHSQEAMSDSLGVPLSIATSITGKSLTTQNTYYPVLSIRLKSANLNGVVLPHYLQAGTLDNTFIHYRLILNSTLTGAAWSAHPTTQSIVEYDLSATASTGGTILQQGFASSGYNDRLVLNDNEATGNFQLGRSSLGTVSDTLTIEIAAVNSNKAGIAVMNWIEQR